MKANNHYKEKSLGDDAQLLLIAGIFLSVAIVSLASVMVSLANIDISIDKTSFIKTEYDNVRKEFGTALRDKLEDKLGYGADLACVYFNDTRDTFVFYLESLKNNYFDAEFKYITYNNYQPNGICCYLRLGNGKEYISELVYYDFY